MLIPLINITNANANANANATANTDTKYLVREILYHTFHGPSTSTSISISYKAVYYQYCLLIT